MWFSGGCQTHVLAMTSPTKLHRIREDGVGFLVAKTFVLSSQILWAGGLIIVIAEECDEVVIYLGASRCGVLLRWMLMWPEMMPVHKQSVDCFIE